MFRVISIALGSLFLALLATAAGPGVKVQFVGGTLTSLSAKTTARLDLTAPDSLSFQYGQGSLQLPITESTRSNTART